MSKSETVADRILPLYIQALLKFKILWRFALLLGLVAFNGCILLREPDIHVSGKHRKKARNQLDKLSLKQKAGQMVMVSLSRWPFDAKALGFIKAYRPGGVILLGKSFREPDIVFRACSRLNHISRQAKPPIPFFIAVDQEGGRVRRIRGSFPPFPSSLALQAAGHGQLAYIRAFYTGKMLKILGVNMNCAPVADLYTRLKDPVIANRSFGDAPKTVFAFVRQALMGYQKTGIIAVAKHFPGHGGSARDTHRALPYLKRGLEELHAYELIPFTRQRNWMPVVMTNHIVYEPISSWPASLAPEINENLLRKRMGFRQLIMTDDIYMKALRDHFSLEQIARQSLKGGTDLILSSHPPLANKKLIAHLYALAKGNKPLKEKLDRSVFRILALKAHHGLPFKTDLAYKDKEDWKALKQKGWFWAHKIQRDAVTLYRDRGHLIPIHPSKGLLVVSCRKAFIKEARAFFRALPKEKGGVKDLSCLWISSKPGYAESRRVKRAIKKAEQVLLVLYDRRQLPLLKALSPYMKKTIVLSLYSPVLAKAPTFLCTHGNSKISRRQALEVLVGREKASGQIPLSRLLRPYNIPPSKAE